MPKAYKFNRPDLKARFDESLDEMVFHPTKLAKDLFAASPPGQGFVGFANLVTGELHICPLFNENDGKERIPVFVDGQEYTFVSPKELLDTPSIAGGGLAHEMAAQILHDNAGVELNERAQVNCILGFGLAKGSGDCILESFRNRSASRNNQTYWYHKDYLKMNGALESEIGKKHLIRTIPTDITTKLVNALCEELPVSDENKKRKVKDMTKLTKMKFSSEQFDQIQSGDFPLHLAAGLENAEEVARLIANGVELDKQDLAGQTPLMYAAMQGNFSIVLALVRAGASMDAVDNQGKTARMLADAEGHSRLFQDVSDALEAFKNLVPPDGNVNQANENGLTPLMQACALKTKACSNVVEELIKNGADLNAIDHSGKTPLLHALMNDNNAVVKILVENGAHVDKLTQLVINMGKMSYELTDEDKNAIRDAPENQNEQLNLLLKQAVKRDNLQLAEILIERGVPPTKSLLRYVDQMELKEMENVLKKYNPKPEVNKPPTNPNLLDIQKSMLANVEERKKVETESKDERNSNNNNKI